MPSSGASLYSLYPENLYAEHKNQSGPRLYRLFTRRVQRFRSSLSSMIGARTTSHSNSHQDWNGRELVEFFRRSVNLRIPKVQRTASSGDGDEARQVRWRVLDREREVGFYPPRVAGLRATLGNWVRSRHER